ncbi:MAG: amino acid permease, partial [Chloroflexota bacterium]
ETGANYSSDVNFWIVFAVFFPAVTGIEVGTSLSGDLKSPSKSIPRGTIASILVTAVVYVAVAIWFALHSTPEQLITDKLAMQRIAAWPLLILIGVWASTLSSALGSVLAAPRTLQALGKDSVVPTWMAAQLGSRTEPRMAVLLTVVIAVAIIWVGDLDFVAPIITMFFLNTYGMVNLVAGIEKLVGNPSFRPQFRIPWFVSLLGAVGCYAAMFLINPLATLVAIFITYGIYFLLQQRQLKRTWGDVRSGIWFALARYAVLNLEKQRRHVKNWRPNIIVFTGQPHNREQLAQVATWLTSGRGIVTFFQLIIGDVNNLAGRGLRETARKHIQTYIEDKDVMALAEAEVISNFKQDAVTIAQAHGMGGLEANTTLMGWSGTEAGRAMQLELTRTLALLEKSVLFLHYDETDGFGQYQTINVWWGGGGDNADLMLLLTHILRRHRVWDDANVRLIRIIDGEEGLEQTRDHLVELLNRVRVEAEPVILVQDNKAIATIIAEESKSADLTLMGMMLPETEQAAEYSQRLNALVESVGTVLLVKNSQTDEDLLSTG